MFLCLVLLVCVGVQGQSPIVDTEHGKVIGVYEDEQMSFHGIPYGGPTSAERRFQAPVPASAYKGEFNATNRNITCAQPTPGGTRGTEDCLVLSVHTNNLSIKRPVVVWLGSENYETTPIARYSFKDLVKEGLVIVSLNHRLSIFGFLCLRVPEAPGNAGLLDIVLGLKWIRKNIINFGGDPNNIVLLGHQSGAALADILTLSPIANGLIHKAIILSGSALAPWAISYKNINNANTVGKKLGLSNTSAKILAKSLKNIEVDRLAEALNDLNKDSMTPLFAPCLNSDNILADDPNYLLKSGKFNNIPYITGYTDKEGTIKAKEIINGTWTEKIRRNLAEFLPPDINLEFEQNKNKVINKIYNLYFSNVVTEEEGIDEVLTYVGDVLQIIPILRNFDERRKKFRSSTDSKIFLFEFQYKGTNESNWGYPQRFLNGTKHGDILNHLLNYNLVYNNETKLNYAAKSIQNRFIKFAYTGFPEPDIEKYTSWLPATADYSRYYHISGSALSYFSTSQDISPHKEKAKFWADIYAKYYRPLSSSGSNLMSYGVLIFLCYATSVFFNL